MLCYLGMNNTNRVSRRFTRLPDATLSCFTGSIVLSMTGNPRFPNPLIPLSQLADLQKAFSESCVASAMGGPAATSFKNDCRASLTTALRSQAGYVEHVCRTDLAGLLSSGFTDASPNRAQSELLAPLIAKILNEQTGQLTLRVKSVANARNYQVQIQVGDGGWQEAGVFSKARRIVVQNLTPGTVYQIRVRALGGSTGFSPWSLVATRMSL